MLQQRQRARSNRQQSWMLALGCGTSVAIHLGLIAGISSWWRSPAPVAEPIDITLVEPVEIEPIAVASPPLTKPPQIEIAPTPDRVTQPKPTILKSVSKPIVLKPTPKSVAGGVKPISKPQTTAQPKPKSSSIPTKVKSNPNPLKTAKVNRPIATSPKIEPFPIFPKTLTPEPVQPPLIDDRITKQSNPKAIQDRSKIKTTPNRSFTFLPPQPPQNNPTPKPLDRSIPTTSRSQPISPPIPVQSNERSPTIPKLPATSPDTPITPATTPELRSPMTPSQPRSTTSRQPPAGGNISNNDNKSILRRDRAAGDGLAGNGSRFGSPQTGSNSLPSGAGNSNSRSPGVGNTAPGGDASNDSQTNGGGGLQCIERCQIPKLRDLQDRDGGKDRLRIRIVIDPNGSVLEAIIAKSSDNPQIDAIVLAGIKQMQFKPPGKIIKGIIKANILL